MVLVEGGAFLKVKPTGERDFGPLPAVAARGAVVNPTATVWC
jgi:hypothetical protein